MKVAQTEMLKRIRQGRVNVRPKPVQRVRQHDATRTSRIDVQTHRRQARSFARSRQSHPSRLVRAHPNQPAAVTRRNTVVHEQLH
jgi:hypothetical protein